MDDFKVMHTIGTGAFAIVKLATHVRSMQRCALKIYLSQSIEGIKRKAIEQEIICMRMLSFNESFPKLLSDFKTDEGDIVIV